MALKDTIQQMRNLLNEIHIDLGKAEGGNRAAAQRVRVNTIRLEKLAKHYRKTSVAEAALLPRRKKAGKKSAPKASASAKAKPASRKAKPAARKAKPAARKAVKASARKAAPRRKASSGSSKKTMFAKSPAKATKRSKPASYSAKRKK